MLADFPEKLGKSMKMYKMKKCMLLLDSVGTFRQQLPQVHIQPVQSAFVINRAVRQVERKNEREPIVTSMHWVSSKNKFKKIFEIVINYYLFFFYLVDLFIFF